MDTNVFTIISVSIIALGFIPTVLQFSGDKTKYSIIKIIITISVGLVITILSTLNIVATNKKNEILEKEVSSLVAKNNELEKVTNDMKIINRDLSDNNQKFALSIKDLASELKNVYKNVVGSLSEIEKQNFETTISRLTAISSMTKENSEDIKNLFKLISDNYSSIQLSLTRVMFRIDDLILPMQEVKDQIVMQSITLKDLLKFSSAQQYYTDNVIELSSKLAKKDTYIVKNILTGLYWVSVYKEYPKVEYKNKANGYFIDAQKQNYRKLGGKYSIKDKDIDNIINNYMIKS